MKSFASKSWKALGTTGQILLALTLFYFICKTLGGMQSR